MGGSSGAAGAKAGFGGSAGSGGFAGLGGGGSAGSGGSAGVAGKAGAAGGGGAAANSGAGGSGGSAGSAGVAGKSGAAGAGAASGSAGAAGVGGSSGSAGDGGAGGNAGSAGAAGVGGAAGAGGLGGAGGGGAGAGGSAGVGGGGAGGGPTQGCGSVAFTQPLGRDIITAPDDDAYDFAGSFTLEAWINPSTLGGSGSAIVGHWGNRIEGTASYLLYLTPDGSPVLAFSVDGSAPQNVSGAGSVAIGAWSHVAAVFDSVTNTGRLYLNGAAIGSGPLGGTAFALSGVPLQIGNLATTPNEVDLPFTGVVDAVRVSRAARYADAFVPAAVFTSDASTVALFQLNELNGSSAADGSPTKASATLQGAATFEPFLCHTP